MTSLLRVKSSTMLQLLNSLCMHAIFLQTWQYHQNKLLYLLNTFAIGELQNLTWTYQVPLTVNLLWRIIIIMMVMITLQKLFHKLLIMTLSCLLFTAVIYATIFEYHVKCLYGFPWHAMLYYQMWNETDIIMLLEINYIITWQPQYRIWVTSDNASPSIQ